MKRATACLLTVLLVFNAPLDFALQGQAPAAPQAPTPSQPVPAAPATPLALVLKEGTEVQLKFAQNLHSRSAVIGDPVELVLDEDLKVADAVVARKGARARGTVLLGKESEKKRAGAHELAIRLEYLKAGDVQVKLRGERGAKSSKINKGATVALTLAFGLSGLLIGLSMKHFEIKEGTPVTCYVAEDVELTAAPEAPPLPQPPPSPPQPPSVSPEKPNS